MRKYITVLIFSIILNSCSSSRSNSETVSSTEWFDDPKVTLSVEDDDLPDGGFADFINLELKNVPIGYQYKIFQNDPTCLNESSIIGSGIIEDEIEYDKATLVEGENKFYALITTDKLDTDDEKIAFCLFAGSYYQASVELKLFPKEGGLQISWSTDGVIDLKSAVVSINSVYQTISKNQLISDLDSIPTTVKLVLTDSLDQTISDTKIGTPDPITLANGSLFKSSNDALTNNGFATSGILKVTQITTGDKIGIYSDPTCKTKVVEDSTVNSDSKNIPLPFNMGENSFYIKRIPPSNTTRGSCSSLISYTRGDLVLSVIPGKEKMILIFNGTHGVTATFDGYSDNNSQYPDTDIISPYTFPASIGEHTATITATDNNGNTLSKTSNEVSVTDTEVFYAELLKEDLTIFNSNPGFSTKGKIRVTGHQNGDTLELYTEANCTGTIKNSINGATFVGYFDVDFAVTTNNFYVKKISILDSNNTACFGALTYTRSKFDLWDLYLTTDQDKLTATWSAPDPLAGTLRYDVNIMPGDLNFTQSSLTRTVRDLTIDNYTVTITTYDNDTSATIYGVKKVEPLNNFVKIFSRQNSKRAVLYPENDLQKNIIPHGDGSAFAALREDGSIYTWGQIANGAGEWTPTGGGFTDIAATNSAFAALKADGTIYAWGSTSNGGTGAPTDGGYADIAATDSAFAALKADGTIHAWGSTSSGGTGAPTDNDYIEITATDSAFAALKADGTIHAWGNTISGGTGAPTSGIFISIAGSDSAFAALNKKDGSIFTWSRSNRPNFVSETGFKIIGSTNDNFFSIKEDGSIFIWNQLANTHSSNASLLKYEFNMIASTNAHISIIQNNSLVFTSLSPSPIDTNFKIISGATYIFAGLKNDGSIYSWGPNRGYDYDPLGIPTTTGFTAISATKSAFAALKDDGSISAWGDNTKGGRGVPSTLTGLRSITSTGGSSFAALRSDGSIQIWGSIPLQYSTPEGAGFKAIKINGGAVAAIDKNNSIKAWGKADYGGIAPSGTGFTTIIESPQAFAALKNDGSIISWGNTDHIANTPLGTGFSTISANEIAFAALRINGTIATWGKTTVNPPAGSFTSITAHDECFAALKDDGSIAIWGYSDIKYYSGKFTSIVASGFIKPCVLAALKNDGSIWSTLSNTPIGQNFVSISGTITLPSFTAIKNDGSIHVWGDLENDINIPSGTGFKLVTGGTHSFAAIDKDGRIKAWGSLDQRVIPKETNFVDIISPSLFPNNDSFIAINRYGEIIPFGKVHYIPSPPSS